MPEQQSFLSLITGSFSTPADGNPTVAMVEAAYEHHHLNARYLNCQVAPEALGDAVRGARAMGWVGFNCSMPHKVSVISYLDGLSPSAGLEVFGGRNAPYIWVAVPSGYTSWQVFDKLLRDIQVVITPGVGFGAQGEGYFRVSAFNSRENALEVARRFKELSW